MRRTLLVFLAVTLTISSAMASKRQKKTDANDGDFQAAQDAVTHSGVQNQGHVGFCWAYTLAGFMEGEAKKQNIDVVISPEYLGFYHMYFELQKHLGWLSDQAHHLNQNDLDDAVEDAYQRIYVQNHFFTPNEGNDEKVALTELEISGAVPQDSFDFKLGTSTKETDFEDSIKSFIKANMFSENTLSTFKATNRNGINETLFDSFSKALHIQPPKPDDGISFQGHSLTPKTFVSSFLKFDPSAYVEITTSGGSEQKSLNLIRDVMKKNIAVPIGFDVFEDTNGDGNALTEAEKSGDFSPEDCPQGGCKKLDGGHEVLGVNWTEDSSGNVTSIIIKNSWGHRGGRNDRGEKTSDADDTGFWILEAGYLSQAPEWLFIVPKGMAGN